MNDVLLSPIRLNELESLIQNSVEKALKASNNNSNQTDQQEQIFTVQQAAEFLSLTVPTIYSKCSRSELPYMKKNKRLYFSRTELTDYLKQGRKPTNEEIEANAHASLIPRK